MQAMQKTETKSRPIIFGAESVRAILDGRKTQTRRLKGLELINKNPSDWQFEWADFALQKPYRFTQKSTVNEQSLADRSFNQIAVKCPYGQIGSKLWVRESFLDGEDYPCSPHYEDKTVSRWLYKAECPSDQWDVLTWKPSIFMPREASRITLEILSIRVERLQDISWQDIVAEGLEYPKTNGRASSMQLQFERLWDALNAKRGYSWQLNPFVFVLEFRLIN